MENNLLEQLIEYSRKKYVPMHMPGGKRNSKLLKMPNPYEIDITEIEGFDNLHHSEGILKELSLRCAKLFGAEETLILVNGSSAGILSAICGAVNKGDSVLVARNCHRSVYNAIYLKELRPVYLYPEQIKDENGASTDIYGEITADSIEKALSENPDITAVVITSPTYEGIVSDIRKIAEIVHKHEKILIVDEAHGSHFQFHETFPESAVVQGADAVIQSIHKTLPSLTQTALLHINGNRIDRERVRRYWDMYQTTSPSYVLMAGIANCVDILERQADKLFSQHIKELSKLRDELLRLKNIRLLKTDDISKLVLLMGDGKRLYNRLLEEFNIQLEMASTSYVIAMTSVCDTKEYYERFILALQQIDSELSESGVKAEYVSSEALRGCKSCRLPIKMTIYEALNCEAKEQVNLEIAEGRIAGAGICFYPPGIPLVNPGEEITKEVAEIIREGVDAGLEVIGVELKNKVNKEAAELEMNIKDTSFNKLEKGVYVTCLK